MHTNSQSGPEYSSYVFYFFPRRLALHISFCFWAAGLQQIAIITRIFWRRVREVLEIAIDKGPVLGKQTNKKHMEQQKMEIRSQGRIGCSTSATQPFPNSNEPSSTQLTMSHGHRSYGAGKPTGRLNATVFIILYSCNVGLSRKVEKWDCIS